MREKQIETGRIIEKQRETERNKRKDRKREKQEIFGRSVLRSGDLNDGLCWSGEG